MEISPIFRKGCMGMAVILSLIFYGCGSSTKERGAEEAAGISDVGLETCFNCHADGRLGKYSSMIGSKDNPDVGWLYSPHGNYESRDESLNPLDLGIDNDGYPNYAFFSGKTCNNCHDPLEDGKTFSLLYALYGVDEIGRIDRPVIGCESCHGAGGNHFGLGPLPYPRPGPVRCGQCHNETIPDDHLLSSPESDAIFEDYQSSPHAGSINEQIYAAGSTANVTARCSRCHTDEGVKLYLDRVPATTGYNDIRAFFEERPDVENASNIECRTCHDMHNQGKTLLAEATAGRSAEFNTCTSCHQLLNASDGLMTDAYHDPSVNPFGDEEEIITDTHYDNPLTGEIEGYVLNPAATHDSSADNTNNGACLDCHNPHNADTSINRQWAESGHGDMAGAAWVFYDFKSSARRACQRCHTSTGYRNFAADPAAYDPAGNVFIAADSQKEMLYCWACHTTNTGELRDPGIFAQTSPYAVPADRIAAVPDLAGSNNCMSCHSGRESGQEIKDMTFPDDIVGKNFGSFNSHYLPAGGVLFRTIGYEYNGRDYSNVAYFEHDKIGSDDAAGTGSNGPCAGCHMRTEESHTFHPLKRDDNNLITEITANAQTCSVCHKGEFVLTVQELNELDEGYEASLEIIKSQLAEKKGIYYGTAYPYFFTTSDPAQQNTANAYKNWPDKNTLGAAFNLNMLLNMPAAYVHNSFYTKRLIYDSIDWIDDGVLNDSVVDTLEEGTPAHQFIITDSGRPKISSKSSWKR